MIYYELKKKLKNFNEILPLASKYAFTLKCTNSLL